MKIAYLVGLCGFFWAGFALAEAANPEQGATLHENHCVSCHTSMVGGDGSSLYTRETRTVTDYGKLQNQVERCNQNLGMKWFDTEINNVAAYLNRDYYKFPVPGNTP